MDYTNKALGLRVQTQIPLNVKKYKESEESLKDLGINNNLAFIYEQGLIVYCIQEGTRWEWKENVASEEGLLDSDFIYPDNTITFGIDYSNKRYNFFPYNQSTFTVPDATTTIKGILKLANDLGGTADAPTTPTAVHKTGNETIQGVKQVINSLANQSIFNFVTGSDSTLPSLTVSAQSSIVPGIKVISSYTGADGIEAIVGTGGGNAIILKSNLIGSGATNSTMLSFDNVRIDNDVTPIRIKKQGVEVSKIDYLGNITANSYIKTGGTSTQMLMADGSVKENQDNLQRVITTSTVILDIDNNNTIFINNGVTPITITINSSITIPNFCVGFIQEGTGDVTFVGSGVSLTNPVGLKSKGQGYQTFIERKLATSTFYLLGNTRA